MSTSVAKKLTLALHLDPVASAADKETMAALQHWYETNRQSCADQAELARRIRNFHHDVYLAGLRFYLFDPRLCRQVANAVEQRDLTLDSLAEQLRSQGLWPETPEQTFSECQVNQLQALLAAVNPAHEASAGDQESRSITPALSQQLNEMQTELQRLRQLAEEQAKQLQQMKLAANRKPAAKPKARSKKAEDSDVPDLTHQIEQMKKVRAKGVF